MNHTASHLTRAYIHLDRLTRNMRLLQELAGDRPLWPAIKANAYGHGSELVARHLVGLGYETLCVAHVAEAVALSDAGVHANFLILSASLPEHAETMVAYGCEPVLCTAEMADAVASEAEKAGKCVSVHIMVDTGMGRIGVRPEDAISLLDRCQKRPALRLRGLMSHMPRADETDKLFSRAQIECFRDVVAATARYGIEVRHLANSAAVLDLPESLFDAARPGIAIYGLRPSYGILNPHVEELAAVLEWKTRITFLKEVPAGTGLSYGHAYRTERPSLIATLPVGYGDGLRRQLSSGFDILVGGVRCPQVGRITMDQSLVDVTALRGSVALGDEAVLIGCQGDEQVTADELADKLGTINYEIVTGIAERVPRIALSG